MILAAVAARDMFLEQLARARGQFIGEQGAHLVGR